MAKCEVVDFEGSRMFVVGDRRTKAYRMRRGQEEVYRNRDVSLHFLPKDGDWLGVRLYLVGGLRRRVWHFGVDVAHRRASRVADAYGLKAEYPALLSWVVDFAAGDRREAPPLDNGASVRRPTREEIRAAIDLIDKAHTTDGKPWSFAANTRNRGRYVVDNLCLLMPGLPLKVSEAIVQALAVHDVIRSETVDSRMKKQGLVVNRWKIEPMLERGLKEGTIDV